MSGLAWLGKQRSGGVGLGVVRWGVVWLGEVWFTREV